MPPSPIWRWTGALQSRAAVAAWRGVAIRRERLSSIACNRTCPHTGALVHLSLETGLTLHLWTLVHHRRELSLRRSVWAITDNKRSW